MNISLFQSNLDDLSSRIGQEVIEIGDLHLLSLFQTIAWVRHELSSKPFFVFQDTMTFFDLLGTCNLSDGDFFDSQHKASRTNFNKNLAARCAASFSLELSTRFGQVEHSTSSSYLASPHPLHSIHAY